MDLKFKKLLREHPTDSDQIIDSQLEMILLQMGYEHPLASYVFIKSEMELNRVVR
jgi:hypothetical protein